MFKILGRQFISQTTRASYKASGQAFSRRLISHHSARSNQWIRSPYLTIAPVIAVGLIGYHYQVSRAFAEEVIVETVEVLEDEIPDREVRLLDINDEVEIDAAIIEEEGGEESGSQGAFNPDTGEINWDCPCLGGMAHGPCGEEFKAAFSCFVYSEADPKGVDCIDKFQGMQDCFRKYPEVYSEELREDTPIENDGAEKEASSNNVESSSSETPGTSESSPEHSQQ